MDVVQSFSDEALTECPSCGGRLRKLFGNVGVVFKGSGFYRTDSRGKPSESGSTGEAAPAKKSESSPSPAPTTSTGSSSGGSGASSSSSGGSSSGGSTSTTPAA